MSNQQLQNLEGLSDDDLMQAWKDETGRMNGAYLHIRIFDSADAREQFKGHSETCARYRDEAMKRGLVHESDWLKAKKPWER